MTFKQFSSHNIRQPANIADDLVIKNPKPESSQKSFESFIAKSKVTEKADKLLHLTNHVTSEIFQHISDATDYTSAVKTISDLLVCPNNVISIVIS